MTLEDQKRFHEEDVRARGFAGGLFGKELEKAERLRFLVHGPVKSLGQAAIAFCIAHPAVSVTIPGARNDQQMRENASGADIMLPAEDLARVADIWRCGFAS
jgi:aryl-alcohol dehydrogenase-like predicted oxidoreductase